MQRTFGPLALLTLLALSAPLAVLAQDVDHSKHSEGHGPAASALVSRLELNQGKRWPTDASLREGMAAIRVAFDADHERIHAGKQTDAQYDALAARIDEQVQGIVAHCKLPPDADAQLHYIVGDLLQGVGLMRGSDPALSRHDGAARVHGALRAYGKYFDDPTWPPEATPHARH